MHPAAMIAGCPHRLPRLRDYSLPLRGGRARLTAQPLCKGWCPGTHRQSLAGKPHRSAHYCPISPGKKKVSCKCASGQDVPVGHPSNIAAKQQQQKQQNKDPRDFRKAARETSSSPKHTHSHLSPAFEKDPSGRRVQLRKTGP